MATPRKLRYFFMQDYDNSIYYSWDNGVLDTVTDTTIAGNPAQSDYELNDPINWADSEIKWGRDSTYMGVFRSFSTQYQFVRTAAAILNNIFLTQGVQGQCTLRIQILNNTGGWTYNDLYVSQIDFSKYSNGYYPDGSGYVTVNTRDSALYELLQAYADTTYNVPMIWYNPATRFGEAQPNMEYVYTDGCKLTAQYNYVSAQGENTTVHEVAASIGTPPNVTKSWCIPSMSNIAPSSPYFGNDVMQNNILIGTQIGDDGSGTVNLWPNNNYIIKSVDYADGSPLNAYLTGGIKLHGTYAFGTTFVAAILGLSGTVTDSSGNVTLDTVQSVQILYQKTINSDADESFLFEDNSPGYGTTSPTIFHDKNNPAQISITSDCGVSGVPDGLIYTLAFGLFGTVGSPAHQWWVTMEYPTTAYPYTAYTPTVVQLYMGGYVQYNTSKTTGFRYNKVWEKLVPLMASTQGNFGFPVPPLSTSFTGRSDYLSNPSIKVQDNCPHDTILTSGNALRNFPNYQYLTLSISDMFNDASRRWGMGLGIEGNTLRLENLSYFFDNTTCIADLTPYEIADFSIEPLTNFMGNTLKVGYNNQPYNEYGTLDDYNLNLLFRLPQTRVLKAVDWTCPFNASIYQIEKARADQQANNTVTDPTDTILNDSHLDNQVFLLEITKGTTMFDTTTCWVLQRYSFTSSTPSVPYYVSGLQYPETAFNLGLTPKRNLLRNSPLLKSMCYKMDGQSVLFQSASPTGRLLTDLLQTNLSGTSIREYDDVPVSSLGTPLFIPILFKFSSPQPYNLWQLLNDNPRGYIQFSWQGNTYKGFIWEAGIHPGNNNLFSFQLLATPDTVLTNLQLSI